MWLKIAWAILKTSSVVGKNWHTVAPPLPYRHSTGITVTNHCSTGMNRGYISSPLWHTVAKLGVSAVDITHAGFTTALPSGLTVKRRIASEELRQCPAKSRRCLVPRCFPTSPACFNSFKTTVDTSRWSPVLHELFRFNAVFPGVTTVWFRLAPVSTQ